MKSIQISIRLLILCLLAVALQSASIQGATLLSTGNVSLMVEVTNDIDVHPIVNQSYQFAVEYINLSSGLSLSSTNTFCQVSYNGTQANLSYNASAQKYLLSTSFSQTTDTPLSVLCNSTDFEGYAIEGINITNITVFPTFFVESFNQTQLGISDYLIPEVPFLLGLNISDYRGVQNSSQPPLSLTSANCQIIFPTETLSLTYNGSLYANTTTVTQSGSYIYNASCDIEGDLYRQSNQLLRIEAYQTAFEDSSFTLGSSSSFRQSVLLNPHGTEIGFTDFTLSIFNLSDRSTTYSNNSDFFYEGALAYFDHQNTNTSDLFYSGNTFAAENLFTRQVGGSVSALLGVSLLDLYIQPSYSVFDVTNTGKAHFVVSENTNKPTIVLNSDFTQTQILPSATEPILCYFDANDDDFYDLYYGGDNGSLFAHIYLNQDGTFIQDASLHGLAEGSCVYGFVTNDSKPDLLVFGRNATSVASQNDIGVWLYDDLNWSYPISLKSQFTGLLKPSAILADFDTDGLSDLVVCGELANGTKQTRLYHNNGNLTFEEQDLFNESLQVSDCTLSATDYDNDGDLDLALTGVGGSNPIALLNNTFTQFRVNDPPTAPSILNIRYNSSQQTLFINWSQASDSLTRSEALTYNLEVENALGKLILSGKYPVSSHPVQGYQGNMQYRTAYTLRNVSPSNFLVRVQAVDNGYQKSNWTEGNFTLDDCAVPPSGSFIISAITCVISDNLTSNTSLEITGNGSVRIASNISFSENLSLTVSNGSLDLGEYSLAGRNNSIRIEPGGLITADPQTALSNLTLHFEANSTLVNVGLENSTLIANNSRVTLINSLGGQSQTYNGSIHDLRTVVFNITSAGQQILSASVSNGSLLNLSPSLEYRRINDSGTFHKNHGITISAPFYYDTIDNFSSFAGVRNITLERTPLPDSTGFNSGTNFSVYLTSNVTGDFLTFSNFSNLRIGKSNLASISYNEPLNLTQLNLTRYVRLNQNNVTVLSELEPRLNRSANLTIYNVSYQRQPIINKDGAECVDCTNITFNSSQVSFRVPGFSSFTTSANAQLDSGNQTRFIVNQSQDVAFLYTNSTNASELVQDGVCTLSSNNSAYTNEPLTFSPSIGHTLTLNFTSKGDVAMAVMCNGSTAFEPLNQSLVVSVYDTEPQFYLDQTLIGVSDSAVAVFTNGSYLYTGADENNSVYSSRQEFSGVTLASLSIADLNNDGVEDIVSLGLDDSESLSYQLGGSSLSVELAQIARGDLQVVDYDHDGDVDIIACGLSDANEPLTVIFENTLADSGFTVLGFSQVTHNLSNVGDCSLEVIDLNTDSFADIVLFGEGVGSAFVGEVYISNASGFSPSQNLTGLKLASSVPWDFDDDGDVDIITNGRDQNFTFQTQVYQNTNGTLTLNTTLTSQLIAESETTLTVGRIGLTTQLFITGLSSTQAVRFNGSSFVNTTAIELITPVRQGAGIIANLDDNIEPEFLITGNALTEPIAQIYKSTADLLYQSQVFPHPPLVSADYSSLLELNFTNATQVIYRVGHLENPHAYVSGARGSPLHTIRSNISYTLPEHCLIIQGQAIDEAGLRSNWSSEIVLNNRTEIRGNTLDEDCDGIVQPILPTVTISRTSGSSSFRASVTQNAQIDSAPLEEEPTPEPNQQNSGSSNDVELSQESFTTQRKEFEQRFEITALGDRTKIVERIKNIERTPKESIVVRKTFPKSVLEAASTLISPNEYEIIIEDPVLDFFIGDLDYLEETIIVYTIPGQRDKTDIALIESRFTANETLTEAQIRQNEQVQLANAQEALEVTFEEAETESGTLYTINLDLKEDGIQAQGVEVEQIIPKCILEEVNEQLLERIIAPELIDSVEIKEADPIIVWSLERVDQQQELQLKLDSFREEDCEDEFQVNVLAQGLITTNLKVNKPLLALTYIGIVSVMVLLFTVLGFSHYTGSYHKRPRINRLVKLILKRKQRGESESAIKTHLLHNDEEKPDVREAFEHLDENKNLPHKYRTLQHLGEMIIFVILLTISVLELVSGVSKEWDFLKKIISFVLMLFIFYKVDIVEMLFGQKHKSMATFLLGGMFLMHLKNLIVFAAAQKSGTFSFLDNFYEHVVSSAYIYDSLFFWSGLTLVLGASVYLAARLPIRDGGLGSSITKISQAKHWWQIITRSSWVSGFYMLFFLSVFNRFMEWLAVAIDAVVYVLMTLFFFIHLFEVMHRRHGKNGFSKLMNVIGQQWVILAVFLFLLLLFLKEVIGFSTAWLSLPLGILVFAGVQSWLSHKGHRLQDVEQLSSLSDTLYLRCAKLFKHPATLPLGLTLILVLHLVVDTVIYLFANLTGYRSHLYLGHEEELLLDLFSNSGILARHLADFIGWEQITYAVYYFLSIVGYLLLFAVPLFVFAMYYTHRNTHMSRLNLAKTAFQSHGWMKGFSELLVVFGIPLILLSQHSQIFKVVPLVGESTIGVTLEASQAMLTLSEVLWSLSMFLLIAFISLQSFRFVQWRNWQLRSVLLFGIGAISLTYFYPFYLSVLDALARQFTATLNAATWSLMWANSIQFVFNVLDFLVIYVVAMVILLILFIPQGLRVKIIQAILSVAPSALHREFTSNLHYLHYYKDAKEHDLGNIVHHLKRFVERGLKEGYSESELREYILAHGYPEKLVKYSYSKPLNRLL